VCRHRIQWNNHEGSSNDRRLAVAWSLLVGRDKLAPGTERRMVDNAHTMTYRQRQNSQLPAKDSSMKPLEFEKVSIEEAKWALDGKPEKPGAHEFTDKRTRISDEPLLDVTETWLASLPQDVRPMELALQFPRIANRLCRLWKQVARCEEYLDDLVVDRRGTRKGFPPKITQELEVLRECYALLHPDSHSAWGHVEER